MIQAAGVSKSFDKRYAIELICVHATEIKGQVKAKVGVVARECVQGMSIKEPLMIGIPPPCCLGIRKTAVADATPLAAADLMAVWIGVGFDASAVRGNL